MAADREAGGHYRTLLGFLLRHGSGGVWREYAAREANALLWIALVAVTFLLLRKLAGLARLWAKGSKIPGPPSPSFFGHSKLVAVAAAGCRSGEDLTGYLSKLHEKYGPTVKLWLGPTQLLVSVKDVSVIKEMLIKAEDKLPLTGKAFRLAFGKSSIFVSSFEKVQKRRESLAAYMNERLLERVNTIPLKVVECVMGRTDSVMSKGILDCKSFSQQIAFYILGVTLFEDTFLNWSDATLYEELFRMIAKDACFWASYRIPPFWRRGYWRYQLLCGRLKHLTQEIIQKCRNDNNMVETKSCGTKGKKSAATLADDILSSGSLFHKEMEGHLISKEEPCGNILGVMFHGYLTIASLVCNILTRLVLYPELQETIYSEIVAVQKKKGESDSYDVQKMQFLLATVYESARLVPPGPLLQRCSLKHDLILESSINIPAGAILVVPLQLVQMDNSIWGKDACQFNPHRFLSKAIDPEGNCFSQSMFNGAVQRTYLDLHTSSSIIAGSLEMQGVSEEESLSNISEPDRNAAFLPFGSGTRVCIGQKFSILGISTLFASLLQNYEVRLQPGSEDHPKSIMDECLHLVPTPKIVFTRRNN